MSTQHAQGIAGLRKRLAEEHENFAAADAVEHTIEQACLDLRSRLKAARQGLGIDQSALAKRLQVGQPMISRIENGSGDIGIKTLYRYVEALGLTLTVDISDSTKILQHELLGPTFTAVEEALENVDKARELLMVASEQLAAAE